MNHRPRITLLFVLFLVSCVLTVMLFASLPVRPNGPGMSAIRSFGPDAPEIDRLSCRTADELNRTLVLLSPKKRLKQ